MQARASRHTTRIRKSAVLASLLLALGADDARSDPAPRPEVARGKFLVASDQLRDPNFRETVVLILEYTPTGALGVVINRPTDVKLATVLPQLVELRGRSDLVFLGGPIARDRMILLVRATTPPKQSARVLDGVFISSSLDVLRGLSRGKPSREQFRTYVGYTGWGRRQLDAEIARGDWRVTPAEPASVFDTPPAGIWRELNERASGQWVRAPAPRQTELVAAAGPVPIALPRPQRSIGGVALPPPARKAWRASTLALTS